MVSGSVDVKVTGEGRADAKREQCGVEKIDKKLFHGLLQVVNAGLAPRWV